MVKRTIVLAIMGGIALGAATLGAQTRMRNGEMTIFLKNGDPIVDKIKDISEIRLVLATENSGEINLSAIWMLNFIDDSWNFPAERNQMDPDLHYIFQRNGNAASGQITGFDRDRQVFQFDNGVEIPIAQVRRIYFGKNVPRSLSGGQPGGQPEGQQEGGIWVGTYRRDVPAPAIEIFLGADGGARMTIETVRGRPEVVLSGRWENINAQSIRVTVISEAVRTDRRTMVFGLERDTLVSLSGSLGSNVYLQRR